MYFSAIPNATAIEALKNFTNSPIVPFYEALRELYLTNGFDKHVLFNGVILGQTIIPDFQWKELVRALENSFGDVKNGDVYFRRIKGMIKMNEPDALILEPWLINLVSMILEKSENSKNVAYSIRDLGVHLIDTGYPRVNYPNGTILRKAINEWTSLELSNEPYRANWTEPLLILHHTIGPENFNLIGDILEAQPWKTKSGMCFKDSEYFKNYKLRLNAAISNADIGFKLLSGIRNAFENATAAAKEDTLLNFLVHADLNDLSNVPVSDKEDRNSRSNAEMSKIWSEINNEQAKTKFVEAMKSSGIGELEKAKNAFIAGARLIKNLGGSVENANKKCEEVVKLNEVFPSAHESLNSAIQILLKLNETESAQGRPGYKYLFDMYFEGNTLGNIQLFSSSRFQNRYYMLQLFDTIQKSVADELLPIIQYIISQRMSLSKFRTNVEKLNNDLSLMTALPMYFGRFFAKSPPRAVQIREVLRNINGLSRTDEDLMDYAKSIAAILKTNNINNMIQLTKLSRDGLWLDVYDSLVYVFTMSAGPSDTFKGLESMIGTTGSYQEVFLAMQTILESPETSHLTCKFIKEFFTGLEDATSVVEAFGVNTGEIRRQNEVTTFVNALIQLLKASESREALGRMIAFHGAFTTNPNATISALHIADMLEYFGATGWN
ncbi:hypothetical protein B9Z55_009129 [Caenorhabditis nigoni]|uniref:Uncharacterized protein n=1 Tax=Caenorhabditis nigoni TaxID=1611254 RepID=A0A2G5UQP4_9PELO|nr:hypothetical protein B9Z55_009129 [Caenorhabditis nigoni]